MQTTTPPRGAPPARRRTLFAALAGVAAIVGALQLAIAAGPPAGTSIGNQASATYDDGSGTLRTATSNTVATIVQQVASHQLTASQSKTAAPGQLVVYPHTVINTGNGSDAFALTVTANTGTFTLSNPQFFADLNGDGTADDTTQPILRTPTLTADQVFNFVVAGTVPAGATAGQSNSLTIRSTSFVDGANQQTNTDTTAVSNNAVLNLTKAITPAVASPGQTVTVALTFTNVGNVAASNVIVADALPAGLVYRSATGRVNSSTVNTNDAAGNVGDPAGVTYTATASNVTVNFGTVSSGQSVTIAFQVGVVTGTASGSNASTRNTATIQYNDGVTGVGPFSSNTVQVVVNQAEAVVVNGSPTSFVLNANEPVLGAPSPAFEGAIVTFTAYVHNAGNGTDTYDLSFAGSTFPVGTAFSLLQADGATPIVGAQTGPVLAGATFTTVVRAQLPTNVVAEGSTAGPFTVNLVATSRGDTTQTESAPLTLNQVNPSQVDLSGSNGGVAAGVGRFVNDATGNTVLPGNSVNFPLRVTNTAGLADTYNLTVAGLPAGASVQIFADLNGNGVVDAGEPVVTNSGTLSPGAGTAFVAVVTVANGTAPSTTTITFRAESTVTGAFDTMTDSLIIQQVRALAFQPSNTGQVFPSGSVVYAHQLTNAGNVDEGGALSTISFTTANTLTFTSAVFLDVNGNGVLDGADGASITTLPLVLTRSSTVTVFVKVFAPAGAPAGSTDVATTTVSVTNGTNIGAPPASRQVTDATTVIGGDVTLTKEQGTDTLSGTTPFAGAFTTGNVSARPGNRIIYRLTVTNTGTTVAQAVRVTDTTPSFTRYLGTTAVAPATVTTQPSVNGTGSIVVTVGDLAPGASSVVTIFVQLDSVP